MSLYATALKRHYDNVWKSQESSRLLPGGEKITQVSPGFEVLEIAPHEERAMWTYATVGMAGADGDAGIELHVFSNTRNVAWKNILEAVAHFSLTDTRLNIGHTVNFGAHIEPGSNLTHGLISLPYLDGPPLEHFKYGVKQINCLWLIPISQSELKFKMAHGLEALEDLFEEAAFSYADPVRPSVV